MNIKCVECEAELELPLYVPGVGYKARVGCPGCKTILYIAVDNSGNILEYRKSEDQDMPNEQMPEEWWNDWKDKDQAPGEEDRPTLL